MASIFQRVRSGWNAFMGRDPTTRPPNSNYDSGYGYSYRPDRIGFTRTNARSVVASIYNRIALDVSQINIEHAKTDENGQYAETINSDLNNCLTLEANVDQTGRALIQDIVQSMFDEGCVAVVPTDADFDPTGPSEAYKIYELRVGRILEWYPYEVKVRVYNERVGHFKDIIVPKSCTAIIENPFYAIMNEPNSTLQRLLRTINKLDEYNAQSSSGKLDMIIQLPYQVKSEQRRAYANQRRKELEEQLEGSRYGIAWADGTEHITQLNRSLDNNLWDQVKDLSSQLYNQLGLTQGVIDGSADEAVMINYFNNTIAPVCTAICDELKRKFLSKTARTQGQSIVFFRDPFKLVPVSQLADIADKFRRNEIMTSNELRAEIGMKPSKAENAEELRNPNLNKSNEEMATDADAQNLSPDEPSSSGEEYSDETETRSQPESSSIDIDKLIDEVMGKGGS